MYSRVQTRLAALLYTLPIHCSIGEQGLIGGKQGRRKGRHREAPGRDLQRLCCVIITRSHTPSICGGMSLPATRPRILCVDDHEDTCFVIKRLLEKDGYEVLTADNVAGGLRLAQEEAFDLYLIDLKLPDGTGKALCEQIRGFDRHTPIIFYSAHGYESDRQWALACGAQGYVVKPDIDSLRETIDRIVPSSYAHRWP